MGLLTALESHLVRIAPLDEARHKASPVSSPKCRERNRPALTVPANGVETGEPVLLVGGISRPRKGVVGR